MPPITFHCCETLDLAPEQIAEQILELAHWPDFAGYGVVPGITQAEFALRTPEVVGSRIRVANTDGSSHVEQILEWQPNRRLKLDMQEFSAPLKWLATGIEETWEFEPRNGSTKVIRSFRLHPKSILTRPLVWLIARLLRKAIVRHLQQMRLKALA